MPESVENTSITISLKMLWTFAISLLVGSFSVAGLYFNFNAKLNEMRSEFRENKSIQIGKDQVQDLSIETLKLNVQKIEIDLKEYRNQLNTKKDK
jgi:hypothetical protein